MSIAIVDTREWQRTFDLKTGKKLEISNHHTAMVKEILARHPFPGDREIASTAWVTDTALELIGKYNPQFAFITYSFPYFTFRFQHTENGEKKRIIEHVFAEVYRFVRSSGFAPVIVGSGSLTPLRGYIDLSHTEGIAVVTNWAAGYAGIQNPSAGDLKYIANHPMVEKVVTRDDLLELFQGSPEEALRLPDYLIIAKEGFTFKAPGTTLRKAKNIPVRNSHIPVASALGEVDTIIGVRKLIEQYLPYRRIALIVIEGLGEDDFYLPFRRCRNGIDWYNYEQSDLQFFALNMGRHNFLAYPQGYSTLDIDDEAKPYPLSGYFYDIAEDTIGSGMGIRRISIGSRSMLTHATTGADICIECFARNLANQGCMAVINI